MLVTEGKVVYKVFCFRPQVPVSDSPASSPFSIQPIQILRIYSLSLKSISILSTFPTKITKMKVFTALVNLALASSAVAVAVDSRVTLPGFAERACGTTGGTFKIASPARLGSRMTRRYGFETQEMLLTMSSFQTQLLALAVTTAAPTATLTLAGHAPTRLKPVLRKAVSLDLFKPSRYRSLSRCILMSPSQLTLHLAGTPAVARLLTRITNALE